MFENFKSDQLTTQQSETITGGRGRGRGRRGQGMGMSFATAEEKAAFMAKKEEFRTALTALKEGEAWSTLTRDEKKAQKQALRTSIFGTDATATTTITAG